MFQASNQREFDNWVRTIAIELIRQTPLDAIKYLDIFTLTPQKKSNKNDRIIKDCNHNCLLTPIINEKKQTPTENGHFDENRNICLSEDKATNFRLQNPKTTELHVTKSIDEDEQTVELLLKKCQNSDSYVPVKEKLKLFESLCRLGRYNEDTTANVKYASKRTRSLHDLSYSENLPHNAGVKQICKYFETKSGENKTKDIKYNTIARIHRTSLGPVKTLISRKHSVQAGKH